MIFLLIYNNAKKKVSPFARTGAWFVLGLISARGSPFPEIRRKYKLLAKRASSSPSCNGATSKLTKLTKDSYDNWVRDFPTRDRKMPSVQIRDKNNNLLLTNLFRYAKNTAKAEHTTRFHLYPKRGELTRNKDSHRKLSISMLQNRKWKNGPIQKFAFRARHRYLPTNDQVFNKTHNKDNTPKPGPPLERGEQAVAQFFAKQAATPNQECCSCQEQVKENIEHIYSGACPARVNEQAKTARKVRRKLHKLTGLPQSQIAVLPLWFPDPESKYRPQPASLEYVIHNFEKTHGALGMIPRVLPKLLLQWGVKKQKAHLALTETARFLIRRAMKSWAARRKEFHKERHLGKCFKEAKRKLKEKTGG